MRIGNLGGRTVVVAEGRATDVETASGGRFPASTLGALERWDEFLDWASTADLSQGADFDQSELLAPVTDPRQIFAIGLNYRDHAEESGLAFPDDLVVFTKFASSITGPYASVKLPSKWVDYETELVVVIGKEGHHIAPGNAWAHVAGLSVGQDYSEREVQRRGPAPQFSLGKSYPGFAPYGPYLVTPDEVDDRDALSIRAVLEGGSFTEPRTLQDGNSRDLIFPVPQIIADLSEVVTLYPGDLIFTGTPAGIGGPQGIFLEPGQTLTSTIDGVGTIRNTFF